MGPTRQPICPGSRPSQMLPVWSPTIASTPSRAPLSIMESAPATVSSAGWKRKRTVPASSDRASASSRAAVMPHGLLHGGRHGRGGGGALQAQAQALGSEFFVKAAAAGAGDGLVKRLRLRGLPRGGQCARLPVHPYGLAGLGGGHGADGAQHFRPLPGAQGSAGHQIGRAHV